MSSLSAFFAQGGYGGFVWGAYGMVLALMIAEVIGLRRRRRAILARIGRLMRLRASGGGE